MADGQSMRMWNHTSAIAAMALNSRGNGYKWVEARTLNPYLQRESEPKPRMGNIAELAGLCPKKRT